MSQEDASDLIVDPTGTDISASNAIVELDAHLDDDHPDHPEYTPPSLSTEDLSVLADALGALGADDSSSRLEIERRHVVDNDEHVPRFTAGDLTELAVNLAIVRVTALYQDDRDTIDAVSNIGRVIKESHDAPLDGDVTQLDFEGVAPGPGQGDYIDPFKAITGDQLLLFTDENGEPIETDES